MIRLYFPRALLEVMLLYLPSVLVPEGVDILSPDSAKGAQINFKSDLPYFPLNPHLFE